jgi:putative acetyltransferase
MPQPSIDLLSPQTQDEFDAAREILDEYGRGLGIDLCFQDFDSELRDLPGQYDDPHGALMLAWVDGQLAGCCAMRPLVTVDYPNACEMKRLYVREAYRQLGLGRQLAQAILDAARVAGYRSVLLDTLDDMEMARALYAELGFTEISPYYYNPIPGAHYLKADL